MGKMSIKRTINGVEHEFELTEEEIYRVYLAQMHENDTEDCDEFLDSVEDLMNLLTIHLDRSDKAYENFLSSMADCYRENVNNGMAMGEPETFETSFWNAFSLIECHVDVAENSYVVENMFRYGYTWNGMIPMSSAAARELFGKFTIYALYTDGSEAEVTDKDDVEDGVMYGVHLEDWNRPFK